MALTIDIMQSPDDSSITLFTLASGAIVLTGSDYEREYSADLLGTVVTPRDLLAIRDFLNHPLISEMLERDAATHTQRVSAAHFLNLKKRAHMGRPRTVLARYNGCNGFYIVWPDESA